jgi:putative ABC transport system permease protein
MAMGATPRRVLALVLGQGLPLAALGIAIGLASSMALARVLSGVIAGIQLVDATPVWVGALLVTVTTTVASSAPAWRAMRIDPIAALRDE